MEMKREIWQRNKKKFGRGIIRSLAEKQRSLAERIKEAWHGKKRRYGNQMYVAVKAKISGRETCVMILRLITKMGGQRK